MLLHLTSLERKLVEMLPSSRLNHLITGSVLAHHFETFLFSLLHKGEFLQKRVLGDFSSTALAYGFLGFT